MINFITISAPSGAGKTTLCKALRSVQPDIEWSISHTTRSKRDIEIDGVDYHFITIEKFEELILEELKFLSAKLTEKDREEHKEMLKKINSPLWLK